MPTPPVLHTTWQRKRVAPSPMAYCEAGGPVGRSPPSGSGGGGRRKTLAEVMATRAPRPASIRPEATRAAEAAARRCCCGWRPRRRRSGAGRTSSATSGGSSARRSAARFVRACPWSSRRRRRLLVVASPAGHRPCLVIRADDAALFLSLRFFLFFFAQK